MYDMSSASINFFQELANSRIQDQAGADLDDLLTKGHKSKQIRKVNKNNRENSIPKSSQGSELHELQTLEEGIEEGGQTEEAANEIRKQKRNKEAKANLEVNSSATSFVNLLANVPDPEAQPKRNQIGEKIEIALRAKSVPKRRRSAPQKLYQSPPKV